MRVISLSAGQITAVAALAATHDTTLAAHRTAQAALQTELLSIAGITPPVHGRPPILSVTDDGLSIVVE